MTTPAPELPIPCPVPLAGIISIGTPAPSPQPGLGAFTIAAGIVAAPTVAFVAAAHSGVVNGWLIAAAFAVILVTAFVAAAIVRPVPSVRPHTPAGVTLEVLRMIERNALTVGEGTAIIDSIQQRAEASR
ncbi:MAG TPA: hypothetical protein VFP72_13485 [Kineosporiaceae bacterium]|nr:hypothetical protein [Kineosporiaceae bacterium]